jgi:hypothetical protein
MKDALLVGVLYRLADGDEEIQPLADRELGVVAEPRQRLTRDELHHEERAPGVGEAAVEDLGDIGMVHHRQRLTLLLEPLEDGAGAHARLDELERHLPFDRCGLVGDPDLAHAALAELLGERVAAGDDRARSAGRRIAGGLGRRPKVGKDDRRSGSELGRAWAGADRRNGVKFDHRDVSAVN